MKTKKAKLKLCIIHESVITDQNHLEFVGNIPRRYAEMLSDQLELHFVYPMIAPTSKTVLEDAHLVCHCYQLAGKRGLLRTLLGYLRFVQRILTRERFGVVMNLSSHYGFAPIILIARATGAGTITRVAGILPLASDHSLLRRAKKWVGQMAERAATAVSDRTLALSWQLRCDLVARGTSENKIVVVSQGVDTRIFKPRPAAIIARRPRSLLFLGRLTEAKGVAAAIWAWEQARSTYPDLRMVVCGDGPLLRSLSKSYSGDPGIRFLGFVHHDRLPMVYADADIRLLPSTSEGLPNAVLEAMSSRVAAIAMRVGEIPRMFENDRGVVIEVGDLAGLHLALLELIANKQRRLEMTKKAREYVVREYSFDAVRQMTMQLFSEVST